MVAALQRRQVEREKERCIAARPAPFDKVDGDAAGGRPQGQTQGGRRGVGRMGKRAQQEEQALPALGRQMQAAQGVGAHLLLPEQQGATGAAAQDLFCRPQGVAAAAGAHPHQLLRPQTEGGQAQGLGRMGRLQQHNAARGHCLQGRPQEAQLADAVLLQEQVDQAGAGPAAARQLGGEHRVAGIHPLMDAARQLGCEPQSRMHGLRRGQTGWDRHDRERKVLYFYTVYRSLRVWQALAPIVRSG